MTVRIRHIRTVSDMREILFIGKRVDNGEWVEGYYGVFKDKHQIFVPFTAEEEKANEGHFLSAIGGLWFTVIPETVRQYTGLPDMNGKKIFDGSIIKVYFADEIKTGTVKYSEDTCRFTYVDKYKRHYLLSSGLRIKVIGNTYDNPELLKGGEQE